MATVAEYVCWILCSEPEDFFLVPQQQKIWPHWLDYIVSVTGTKWMVIQHDGNGQNTMVNANLHKSGCGAQKHYGEITSLSSLELPQVATVRWTQ